MTSKNECVHNQSRDQKHPFSVKNNYEQLPQS